ncbi:MAG: HNH endonuclease signature motif containing protein [Proteobacteria bacterium]|nr:HNH endonuclease signature motif containing protein [Pseudomonadota bacterium]
MSYLDVTEKSAVLKAIKEFDELGRDKFLEAYGFGHARSYFISYDGKEYDCKPILWAAYKHQFGTPLLAKASSGVNKTVRPKLEGMGFVVTSTSTVNGEVERAFRRYKDGDRPWRLVEGEWYVSDKEQDLYPAKYIWALVISAPPRTFHTSDARKELAERGYSVVNITVEKDIPRSVTGMSDEELFALARAVQGRPQMKLTFSVTYERNRYVAEAALRRAGGICQQCEEDAPFKKRKDGSPYLETHHKVHLADGGDDTLDNTEALCPNCHRKKHHG